MTYHPPHITRFQTAIPGAPDALHLAPKTANHVEIVLRYCSERDLSVQVWGGGTHSGFGDPPHPDVVVSTQEMADVQAWDPDDLTIVVGAGAPVEKIEAMLAERNQSLVMPERPATATVGGVVSSGVSSYRRGRLYATRERVLEVIMVTGDGRTVRSGGRVVKNVSGYDLHRLAVGAFGSLGLVVSVCLKLWPTPPVAATVTLDDPEKTSTVIRPLAVLDVAGEWKVFLQGTDAELAAQVARLGGKATAGHDWPDDPAGAWRWSLRVPQASTAEAVGRLPEGWRYVAVHGVGEVRAGSETHEGAEDLREWAESLGGSLVMVAGDPSRFDPWGTPPPALELQRRLISEFDPRRILNRGRLPGGL